MTAYVHRVPRAGPPAPPAGALVVAAPPPKPVMQAGSTAWLQFALPVLGGLGALVFVLVNPKPLYIATGLLFAISAIGAGTGMALQQRTSFRRQTRMARDRYQRYLDDLREVVLGIAGQQRADAEWRHPPPAGLLAVATARARVWERRTGDADFLEVRVGAGARPLASPLQTEIGSPALATYDPVCEAALERLAGTHGVQEGLPITVPLARARVVTLVGPREAALPVARALVGQLATWHAPNDVRLAVCAEPREDWEWCKWLPHLHVWDPLAAPAPPPVCGDAVALAGSLSVLPRVAREDVASGSGPWVVAVVDAPGTGLDRDQLLRQALATRASLVMLVPTAEQEPPEVDLRLVVDGESGLRAETPGAEPAREASVADALTPGGARALARALAPLRLGREAGARRLAETIELDELVGIPDARALQLDRLWRPRPLRELLRAPIGVDPQGGAVVLDLKESALGGDGPHGLVIGATGSGKSELLKTVVTGLALTHSPDLLSFVLVDFKGGAAFAGLNDLPHVAGFITNLADDLGLIDRMRDALFGEMRRRQQMLKAAGNLGALRQYHQRMDLGAQLEPLPYLLVVIDEFAELLAARPDFIDLFVAIGRLGRSLGVHLMLASQQLEEGRLRGLEGHLSYRFALRTFSVQESRTVIGTPDAYELPPLPGSGYLKVGTTAYTRFRAATVSMPHGGAEARRSRRVATGPFDLEHLEAAPAATAVVASPVEDAAGPPSMLDVVVAQLRDAAPKVHQVWLPPLETRITLDSVPSPNEELVVPVGLVDRPIEQRTEMLTVDFRGTAGHLLVVGSSQTGKSTLVRTLICACALTHTPLQAQFSCIDYGGGGLASLADLPHVGGVCGRNDEERVTRTLAEIATLIDDRERRFRELGIDSAQAMRARRAAGEGADGSLADVFLVIDNWPAVKLEFEELEPALQDIATRGLGYGVHVLVTASRWMDVRAALREAVGGRLELRLNDPSESMVDRRAASNVATGVPGRGLTADKLHFQAALPRVDGRAEVLDLPEAVERLVAGVRDGWSGPKAPPVRVLPRLVGVDRLPAPGADTASGVPIGISGRDLGTVYLDLAADPFLVVFGDGESGKTTLLRTLISGLIARRSEREAQILVVDYRRALLGLVPEPYLLGYAAAEPTASGQVGETAEAMRRRLPPAELTADELRSRSWWKGPEVYVVVDDYDLVATAAGNPLLPLLQYLPMAQDVGLHVVLARRVAGAGRAIYEPVLQRIRELGSPGIVLAGDPQEGALLGTVRASALPPGRGTLVRRRERPELIQVAVTEE
jgi:DNA segregation ATPase FtsK/SpoIIIE, S-DNA-T family